MSDQNCERYGGLFRIIKPVNRYIYSAMGLAALGSMATVSTLLMLSLLVAVLIQGKECLLFCGISWTKIQAVTWVCLSGVLAFCLTMAGFGVSHLAAFNLEKDLRIRLSKHLARLPLGFIITTGTGALKKVMLEDVKNLHAFVADSTPAIGRGYAAAPVTLVILFIIDWRLACIALGVMAMGLLIMCIAMRDNKTIQEKYEKSQSQINTAVIEFIQAMPVVRTFDDGPL
ncbi:ABC transporter transmembrane domain-containing protein [uncultured Desulfobacter sp.]|uniref:ABC transporter transmembrane domain-containing protein n=1 Tax=uncultured Desulfobacter sp. TaxID=240139 RepID=UPI002AA5EA49|nr:ABC transporter transmembrane domain-containing protein [uncultured Desulfobacter sp.]